MPFGLCPSSANGSALWHVPAVLSPCALCTLDELLDILAFFTWKILEHQPDWCATIGFGFILVNLTDSYHCGHMACRETLGHAQTNFLC